MSKQKFYNISKWIAILPVSAIVWSVLIGFELLLIIWLDTNFNITEILNVWWICFFVTVPILIAEFFISKLIAPKNKNICAIIVTCLVLLWQIFFFYAMSHLAY